MSSFPANKIFTLNLIPHTVLRTHENSWYPELFCLFWPRPCAIGSLDGLCSYSYPQYQPILIPPKPTLTPGPINWFKFQRSKFENSINLQETFIICIDLDENVLAFSKAIPHSVLNACAPRLCLQPSSSISNALVQIQKLLLSKCKATEIITTKQFSIFYSENWIHIVKHKSGKYNE